jgi:hypothetical protein
VKKSAETQERAARARMLNFMLRMLMQRKVCGGRWCAGVPYFYSVVCKNSLQPLHVSWADERSSRMMSRLRLVQRGGEPFSSTRRFTPSPTVAIL